MMARRRPRRVNPMRMPPTMKDYFAKAMAGSLLLANVLGLTVVGILSLSENDPRKKMDGPLIVRDVDEDSKVSSLYDINWEEFKLGWMHVMDGVKIGSYQPFKTKVGVLTVDDYLRLKQEQAKAERDASEKP